MTRIPPCCCEPLAECAFMFMRVKFLDYYPTFSTPSLSFWTKRLSGYTGTNNEGWFIGANGLSGCTCSTVSISDLSISETEKTSYLNDGITQGIQCNNIGIDPEHRLDTIKFFAGLSGDNVNWYGKQVGISYTPKVIVQGSVILPKRYEGMTLDNSELQNGKLTYKFVKGVIPQSLRPFYNNKDTSCDTDLLYTRAEPNVLARESAYFGPTAGVSLAQISNFKVYYSDAADFAIRSSNDIFFSVDGNIDIPEGYWFREGDKEGGAPYVINGHCVNVNLRGCNSIPYAYFQTIPENVYLLSLNLAKCKNSDGSDYVSITDTHLVNSFSLQKAIISSDSTCIPSTSCIEDLSNDETFGSEICTAWGGAGVPPEPVKSCSPVAGIGKGFAWGEPECSITPEIPCHDQSGPCASYVDCSLYEPEDRIIEVVRKTDIYEFDCSNIFPGNCRSAVTAKINGFRDMLTWAGPASQYIPYWATEDNPFGLCGKTISSCTSPGLGDCSSCTIETRYECILYTIKQNRCKSINLDIPLYYREWGERYQDDGSLCGVLELYDTSTLLNRIDTINIPSVISTECRSPRTYGDAACCCCSESEWDCSRGDEQDWCCDFRNLYDGPLCDANPPDLGNAIIVKIPSDTDYEPNPYLMYTNNPLYFESTNGITLPNFSKYIKEYRNTWVQHRLSRYPNANRWLAYVKNPQCTTSKTFIPEYFFLRESTILEFVPPIIMADCSTFYKRLPNYDIPCKSVYGIDKNYNPYSCKSNVKHKKLEEVSFRLACNELLNNGGYTYGSSACWNGIKQAWNMRGMTYQGTCGITANLELVIQMPDGITLNDCTNLFSWEILSKAPK